MKIEGWLKLISPFLLVVGGYILLVLVMAVFGLNPCATYFSSPHPANPELCNNVRPLFNFIALYTAFLVIETILVILWEALAKIFGFKLASSIRLRWYFIMPIVAALIGEVIVLITKSS